MSEYYATFNTTEAPRRAKYDVRHTYERRSSLPTELIASKTGAGKVYSLSRAPSDLQPLAIYVNLLGTKLLTQACWTDATPAPTLDLSYLETKLYGRSRRHSTDSDLSTSTEATDISYFSSGASESSSVATTPGSEYFPADTKTASPAATPALVCAPVRRALTKVEWSTHRYLTMRPGVNGEMEHLLVDRKGQNGLKFAGIGSPDGR